MTFPCPAFLSPFFAVIFSYVPKQNINSEGTRIFVVLCLVVSPAPGTAPDTQYACCNYLLRVWMMYILWAHLSRADAEQRDSQHEVDELREFPEGKAGKSW